MNYLKMMETLNFLNEETDSLGPFEVIRSRSNIIFRGITIKVIRWPYFVLEVDHPTQLEQENLTIKKLPSYSKIVKKLMVSL